MLHSDELPLDVGRALVVGAFKRPRVVGVVVQDGQSIIRGNVSVGPRIGREPLLEVVVGVRW